MNKAIFLDRDGTLIKEKHYLHKKEDLEIEDGVIPGLQTLHKKGYLLIIITNQSGIGQELFTEQQFQETNNHMIKELEKESIQFTDTFFCPYHPTKGKGIYKKLSNDRKPGPGMLLKAMEKHQIDPRESYMIGDNITDIQAGKNAFVKTILVTTGYGKKMAEHPDLEANYIAPSITEAVASYIK